METYLLLFLMMYFGEHNLNQEEVNQELEPTPIVVTDEID